MGNTRTRAQDDDVSDLSPLHGAFLEEAGESLARMEALLLAIGNAASGDDTLNAIFRFAHSIKGGAATFGFRDVAELTHVMETLLDALRRRECAVTPGTVDVLLESVDMLTRLLARHQSGALQEIDCSPLLRRVRALAQRAVAQAPMSPGESDALERLLDVAIGPLERPSLADGIGELFTEIAGLGRCEATDGGTADADGVRRFRVETSVGDGELLDLFSFHVPRDRVRIAPAGAAALAPSTPAPSTPAPSTPAPVALGPVALERTSIRVPLEKIDRLIALARELLATHATLAQARRGLDPVTHRALAGGLAALERDARRLHDAANAVRTVPAATVFARFPRLLRDLAVRLGKPLALRTLGNEIELDAALAEQIVDPLTHLVRNAADHGIESPAERLAQGKPAAGAVTLAASRRGGEIVLEVRDDGRGLDRAALLRAAAGRGRALDGRSSDAVVWSLILEPGFSTATQVTDVSGRGVGMDVVRRGVEALGGSIEIASRAGRGVCVSMRLPVTAAPCSDTVGGPDPASGVAAQVREYLVFELAGQEYGIDVLSVREIRGWEPSTRLAGAPLFVHGLASVGGAPVPVVDLRLALGLPAAACDGSTAVVVMRLGARQVGIVVDSVSDVAALEPDRVRPPPPVDAPQHAGFVTGLAELDGRTLILVDIERLLGTPELAIAGLPA